MDPLYLVGAAILILQLIILFRRPATDPLQEEFSRFRREVQEALHTQRASVDDRLDKSFRHVSDRLEQVHKGLGEMQSLATGVGDLKKILANVKVRGTWGEVQLGALLEQVLTPDQYSTNVAVTGTSERVEFALRLPGDDHPVWLPIDAKFPLEDYQRLIEASESGDAPAVERATRDLEKRVRLSARSIRDKYISPPATTDFGILFLPTEGLYAELMRRPAFADEIQRELRVTLAGPSTLLALINSLQMGFRTLAIQKRSSEVWQVLGVVKAEFLKYHQSLTKVREKLDQATRAIDDADVRTRAIQRKLSSVESADDPLVD